jgi:hypothetical protein
VNATARLLVLLMPAVLIAACGGGSAESEFTKRDISQASVSSAASTALDKQELFDWAEKEYAGLFAGKSVNASWASMSYRYYAATQTYLGVQGSSVWILGPTVSPLAPAYLGELADFGCSVRPNLCGDSISLEWMSKPSGMLSPGALADPQAGAVQDNGLNSSFVVRAVRNGQPVRNEAISWFSTDPTASVQTLATQTDDAGLARAWFVPGSASNVSVVVRHGGSGKTISSQHSRAVGRLPALGRRLEYTFTVAAGGLSAIKVSLLLRTTAPHTYYAPAYLPRFDGQPGLYGGYQQLECSEQQSSNAVAIGACDSARGKYRGRIAIYSSWNTKLASGQIIVPKAISSAKSSCKPYGHEGDFLQCMTNVDWEPGDEWDWTVRFSPGAPEGRHHVRIMATNVAKGLHQEVGTMEIASGIDMQAISTFNENWFQGAASSCLDVAPRAMTVTSVGYWDGQRWLAPSRAHTSTMLLQDSAACQNFRFDPGPIGMSSIAGGSGYWANIADGLIVEPGARRYFANEEQFVSQYREVPVVGLRPQSGAPE